MFRVDDIVYSIECAALYLYNTTDRTDTRREYWSSPVSHSIQFILLCIHLAENLKLFLCLHLAVYCLGSAVSTPLHLRWVNCLWFCYLSGSVLLLACLLDRPQFICFGLMTCSVWSNQVIARGASSLTQTWEWPESTTWVGETSLWSSESSWAIENFTAKVSSFKCDHHKLQLAETLLAKLN